MKPVDPPRLVDSSEASPATAEALRAARERLPSGARTEAIARALAAKIGPPPSGGQNGGPAGAKSAFLAKVGLTGIVAGSLVVGGLVLRRRDEHSPSAPQSSQEAPSAVAPPASPLIDEPSSTTAVSVESLPVAPPAPSPAAPRPSPSSAASSGAELPESEVHLLERAQDALRTDPAAALELCSRHARRFPHGAFEQEREVIAIEALVRMGRHAEARQRAERFFSAYPTSADRRRVEQLLGAF